jgi:glycosyltransferase involved in cell wall biosynthesis
MSTADMSVIMPAYNTAAYVGEAISSVLQRADRLLELIVVNDGSTDATGDIVRSFDGPLRVIDQENRGSPIARNVAMAQARGTYFGFLDSDDIWVAPRPDPRLQTLDADPTLAGAYGYQRFFVGDGNGTHELVLDPMLNIDMGALVVRGTAIAAVGGFDETFRLGADLDLFARGAGPPAPRQRDARSRRGEGRVAAGGACGTRARA